ncbi:8305_t:CDS:1, partial [Scutellospora calospora]
HALFHAIRLGPSFLNIETTKIIMNKGGILSRYFIQKLYDSYGVYDPELLEEKLKTDPNLNKDQNKKWCSDLSFDVFILLLNKANILYGDKLNLQGNDMELFHYKTGGSYHINRAPLVMESNIKNIESLIINFKFIPFPPRINNGEEGVNVAYPSFDGFENNKQLNVIARSILLNLKLVNLWKSIGYHDICNHVNSLVMQGAMLILFPPHVGFKLDKEILDKRLKELVNIGFVLDNKTILDIFKLYKHRLNEVGDVFLNSFIEISNMEKQKFISSLLIDSMGMEGNQEIFDFISKYLHESLLINFNFNMI